jgi:hypothetical protein
LVDLFIHEESRFPKNKCRYTWFSHGNNSKHLKKGLRLDTFLADRLMIDPPSSSSTEQIVRLCDIQYFHHTRGSDHIPLLATIQNAFISMRPASNNSMFLHKLSPVPESKYFSDNVCKGSVTVDDEVLDKVPLSKSMLNNLTPVSPLDIDTECKQRTKPLETVLQSAKGEKRKQTEPESKTEPPSRSEAMELLNNLDLRSHSVMRDSSQMTMDKDGFIMHSEEKKEFSSSPDISIIPNSPKKKQKLDCDKSPEEQDVFLTTVKLLHKALGVTTPQTENACDPEPNPAASVEHE